MLEFTAIERLLVVTAHPDDVDFGSAGTVAALTDAGVEVVYCLVTDGQAGGFDRSIPRSEMAAIRREEQTKAAAEVGVTDLRFLGFMDGTVEVSMQLRHDIAMVIRQVRPQVVMTQSPVRNLASTFGSHPDHTATGEATMCAVYPDARNPFAFPGQPCADLDDWKVDEVWIQAGPLGGSDRLDAIDITDQLDRKMRALRCHVSQHTDPDGMEQRIRARFEQIAVERGLPAGRSVELFRVCDTR
jgi:LmbE family N-acetylglucosaminyl deacetylase